MSLPVTVVTAAYGSPETVGNWARSWSGCGVACIVADNGGLVPPEISGMAKVLPFTGNTGFGGGINRAVREADTRLILITNPDTLPESDDSLRALVEHHSSGTLTGGVTIDSSGRPIHSTGTWPTVGWVRSQVFRPAESLWTEDRVDWLQGSLILADREDLQRLGGFSGSYPLFFEDVDLCARARGRGMKISLSPHGRFTHDEGTGSERATATRLSCFHWGMLAYFMDHDPAHANTVRKLIATKCVLRVLAYAAVRPENARGYRMALRSVLSGTPPVLPGAVTG